MLSQGASCGIFVARFGTHFSKIYTHFRHIRQTTSSLPLTNHVRRSSDACAFFVCCGCTCCLGSCDKRRRSSISIPPLRSIAPRYRRLSCSRQRLAHPAAPSHIFAGSEAQVVAHPVGCPRTLFCGCGAARELGLSDPSLWAVKAWYQFPRAAAAPGMALLWGERHVAAIRAVHDDGTVTIYDANSGGGLTRIHRISLAGLVVVDPHAGHHGQPTFASFSPIAREPSSPGRGPDNPVEPKVAASEWCQ